MPLIRNVCFLGECECLQRNAVVRKLKGTYSLNISRDNKGQKKLCEYSGGM